MVVRTRCDPEDVLVLSRLGFPAIGQHRLFVTAIGIDALGSGVWMPLSVLYFVRVPNLSLLHVGVALSIAAALSFPLAIVIGSLVDRYDAKRVLQHLADLWTYDVALIEVDPNDKVLREYVVSPRPISAVA